MIRPEEFDRASLRSSPFSEQPERRHGLAWSSLPIEEEVYNPSDEEIASLAYSYWEARGKQGGSPDDDWFRAKQELRKTANSDRAC